MNHKKIIALVLAIVTIVSGIVLYKKHNRKKKMLPYTVEKPTKRNLVQFITASGTLKVKDQISVGSLVSGKVQKILVDDNDSVKKNQVLAILDNGIGDSNVKRLQATLKEAQAIRNYQEKFYARQKVLYEAQQLSQNQFDQYTQAYQTAQAKVEQIRAQLEVEQKQYDNLFIKSPDDGIVISKNINLGQQITSMLDAKVLFEIAKNLHEMEAYVDVDEADVGMVKDKQEAIFTVDAFPYKRFKSHVKQIVYLAKIVQNVVTYATILDVHNKDLSLRPGMTTNVEIKVSESLNALCVQNKALRVNSLVLEKQAKKLGLDFKKLGEKTKNTQHKTLWVLEDKTIKQILVKFGTQDERYTEVISGINPNTNVITQVFGEKQENILLKQFTQGPGGLGKK